MVARQTLDLLVRVQILPGEMFDVIYEQIFSKDRAFGNNKKTHC